MSTEQLAVATPDWLCYPMLHHDQRRAGQCAGTVLLPGSQLAFF